MIEEVSKAQKKCIFTPSEFLIDGLVTIISVPPFYKYP
jgi:hypothetical protein